MIRKLAEVTLADGFASGGFEMFFDRLGVHLVRPARSNTSDPMPSQLALEQHGSRTRHGICARVGRRLLAVDACIWHNTNIGALTKPPAKAPDSPTAAQPQAP